MELKEVFFKKKTRISGSAQRFSGYAISGALVLGGIVLLLFPFFEKAINTNNLLLLIGLGLVLLFLAYLNYRGTLKLKKIEADEEKIYIHHSKVDIEELSYTQITGGTRGWTLITREFYVKLFFLDEDGGQQSFRFAPRILGNHYDNFVELLARKNPNLKIKRKRS